MLWLLRSRTYNSIAIFTLIDEFSQSRNFGIVVQQSRDFGIEKKIGRDHGMRERDSGIAIPSKNDRQMYFVSVQKVFLFH
jgi:hypothetical protein